MIVDFEKLKDRQERVVVVGLGYVGLPLAVLLAKHFDVVGFDVNEKRIEELGQGIERTGEVDVEDLKSVSIEYSFDPVVIKTAKFVIVAVPTPIDENKVPDLTIVKKATEMVGKNLAEGSIVVYESTVYPGVTEDICVPILEENFGLKFGVDFAVGYSPERVNPGDKEHTIDKITKVVSGSDKVSLEVIASVYGTITNIHKAPTIRVAEAAKVIENTQRDLNVALMNELAMLFYKMGISVYDVIEAAGTKWNFLSFKPGLVGGHCIGVDPYYLTYKAKEIGFDTRLILAGRGINDGMHTFVAAQLRERLVEMGKNLKESTAVIWGITFKENIPDIRNSRVVDLYKELTSFGMQVFVADPMADVEEVKHEYGINLTPAENLPKADLLVVAVSHDQFKTVSADILREALIDEKSIVADIKHIYSEDHLEAEDIEYWSV